MNTVTKSELIEALAEEQVHLAHRDVEYSVNTLLEKMSDALITGRRIEIRGFGSISLRYRAPRVGRNPKTGAAVTVPEKYVPHFKPGRSLRERVNQTADQSEPALQAPDFESVGMPSVLDEDSGG
jgi:integration host factor subunit beta